MRRSSEAVSGPDSDSYEEFFAARSTALFRLAYFLTGQAADAEDLLQSTLLKVYVDWRRAGAVDSVVAYARRMMINEFLSGRRRARHRHEHLVTAPPDLPVPDDGIDDRIVLWRQVLDLPPRQRAVMVLRYVDDLSEAEIALVLGCARGTVKSTASAALKNLREGLASQDGAPS